jgi:hypothetical protein
MANDNDKPFLRYPANLCQQPFDKWIKFSAKAGRHVVRTKMTPEEQAKDVTLASVGLYLPTGALSSALEVQYDGQQLGPFAGALYEWAAHSGKNLLGAKGGGSGISGIKSQLTAVKDDIVERMKGADWQSALEVAAIKFGQDAISAFGGASRLGAIFAGLDLDDAVAVALGQKINPRTEMIFSTQQYREHVLEFMLVPRSLEEAKSIDRILYFFQFYSLPKYAGNSDNLLNAFMIGFPHEFTIDMLAATPDNTNVTLNHINKIGRSVLMGVQFDHAAGGKTSFIKDNGEFYPTATALRLHFREVRLLARGDDDIRRSETPDHFVPLDGAPLTGEFPDPT